VTRSRLVSVVIPAFNATATLRTTLASAMAQSHRALEIIVVDDGSTDDTCAIAEECAMGDARVQLILQQNAGVAAARNAGWRRARADLIAFLDADDLWAPTMIERQLAAFQAGGPRVGLVYSGSVLIDRDGVVTKLMPLLSIHGDVLDRLFTSNFVGNGSASMMTRQALIDADGFDPALRARGAQGGEDYLLQCRIAEKYDFAMVPEHLVGYRCLPTNMSSDRPRMLRSWMLVVDEMHRRHPERAHLLHRGVRGCCTRLVLDAIAKGAFRQLPELIALTGRLPASVAISVPLWDIPAAVINHVRTLLGRLMRQTAGSSRAPGPHLPFG